MLTPQILADLIEQAIQNAQAAGDLPAFDIPRSPCSRRDAPNTATSRPRFACRWPAWPNDRRCRSPQHVADAHARARDDRPRRRGPAGVPQFQLCARLAGPAGRGDTRRRAKRGAQVNLGHGKRTQVEYGSANPTGPLHVGFGRNVVLGDGIANVLEAAGYDVQREYYVNDALTQVDHLADSMDARYRQLLGQDVPFPEEGYPGQYVIDWAQEVIDAGGRPLPAPAARGGRGRAGARSA